MVRISGNVTIKINSGQLSDFKIYYIKDLAILRLAYCIE